MSGIILIITSISLTYILMHLELLNSLSHTLTILQFKYPSSYIYGFITAPFFVFFSTLNTLKFILIKDSNFFKYFSIILSSFVFIIFIIIILNNHINK